MITHMNVTTIEKSGTGIEKSGTGIEKSGTGIEKSGTGIEKSGTGVSRFGHLIWSLMAGVMLLGSPVFAQENLPVFASHADDVLQVSVHLSDDVALGSSQIDDDQVYQSIPLFAGVADSFGCKVNGSGSGDKSQSGCKVNGSGSGDKDFDGCRVNGSGSGEKGCETVAYEWGVAEVSFDEKQIHVLVYKYESDRLAEVGHTVINR